MIAYMFEVYAENFAFRLFTVFEDIHIWTLSYS